MSPMILVGGFLLLGLLASRKKPSPVAAEPTAVSSKDVTRDVKKSLERTISLPVWSESSRDILRKIQALTPDDLGSEPPGGAEARYALWKSLPDEERSDFVDLIFAEEEEAGRTSAQSATIALLAYLSAGGKDPEEIDFWQGRMQMRAPTGTLDAETLQLMKFHLESITGKPMPGSGFDLFHEVVLREFNLIPPPRTEPTIQIGGKRAVAIRGDHPFVRRQHGSKVEIIGRRIVAHAGNHPFVKRHHSFNTEIIGGHLQIFWGDTYPHRASGVVGWM